MAGGGAGGRCPRRRELEPQVIDALKRAAESVKAIAAGHSGTASEAPRATNARLYSDANPLASMSFEARAALLAGATAVGIGYAGFRNPTALVTIIEDLEAWCDERGIKKVSELIGAVRDQDMEPDTLIAASSGV